MAPRRSVKKTSCAGKQTQKKKTGTGSSMGTVKSKKRKCPGKRSGKRSPTIGGGFSSFTKKLTETIGALRCKGNKPCDVVNPHERLTASTKNEKTTSYDKPPTQKSDTWWDVPDKDINDKLNQHYALHMKLHPYKYFDKYRLLKTLKYM
jgi:hypothetical protein